MALSKEKKKGCFYTEISPCLIVGEKGCICVVIEDVAKLGSKLTLLGVALEATRTTVAIWTLRIALDNRLDQTPKRCSGE